MEIAEELRRLGIRVLRVLNGSAITDILARRMALEGRGNPVRWPAAALEASASLLSKKETWEAAEARGIDPDELARALLDAAIEGAQEGWIRLPGREKRLGVVAQSGNRIRSLPRLKVKIVERNEAWREPRPKGKEGKEMRAAAEKSALEAAETVEAAWEQGDLRAAGFFMRKFLENASDGQYLTSRKGSKAWRRRFAIIESMRLAEDLREGLMFDGREVDPKIQNRIEDHRDEIDAFLNRNTT